MRRLVGFLALTRSQRRIFLAALVMLPLAGLGLRVVGFRRVQSLLATPLGKLRGDVRNIESLVAAAARHGAYKANCLPTSLTLQWLLRRHGVECDLRLGVRRADGQIEAHAWLERDGAPLAGAARDAVEFAAFDRAIAGPVSR